jgi:hypothetical protein
MKFRSHNGPIYSLANTYNKKQQLTSPTGQSKSTTSAVTLPLSSTFTIPNQHNHKVSFILSLGSEENSKTSMKLGRFKELMQQHPHQISNSDPIPQYKVHTGNCTCANVANFLKCMNNIKLDDLEYVVHHVPNKKIPEVQVMLVFDKDESKINEPVIDHLMKEQQLWNNCITVVGSMGVKLSFASCELKQIQNASVCINSNSKRVLKKIKVEAKNTTKERKVKGLKMHPGFCDTLHILNANDLKEKKRSILINPFPTEHI